MPRPSQARTRRRQIADALLTLMAKSGYDGASVAAIAEQAGLNQGLVHYYFGSKQAVLLHAIELMAEVHLARLDAALQQAGDDPFEQVDVFIDAHLGLASTADPRMLRSWIEVSGEALRRDAVRAPYRALLDALIARLHAILSAGVQAGLFSCDPQAAACALVSTIQGYLLVAGTSRESIPRGTASRSTQAMARGLLSKGA